MTLKEKVYNITLKDSLAYSGLDNLLFYMAKSLNENLPNVKREFEKLLANGDVYEMRKGKFIAIPSHGYGKGLFMGNAKGFGFVQLGAVKGEHDIFIPGNMTMDAIDGDRVIIKLNGTDEGQVVSIYKPVEHVVGIVLKRNSNFFLEPDNNHIPFNIRLTKSNLKFGQDDRVVAETHRNGNGKLSARVVEVLGKSDDVKAMEKGIIREHELYEAFPTEVIKACDSVPRKVTEKQKKGRLDLTKETIFTIDGEDAKDFDDAVSIKRTHNGYELGVHIADVGEYVKRDSVIDEEAFRRGTSVYFPGLVLPMLPETLSNGICSLQEGVERLTLSVIMQLDEKGKVLSYKICESVIKSCARLTYTQVQGVFDGQENKASKVNESLRLMLELAQLLEKQRTFEGNLDFDIPECEFVFDEEGKAVGVEKRERNQAHRLIEDFMVLANEVVAREFKKRGVPFVYRVHESPKEEKLSRVLDFMKGLGIKVPQVPKDDITPTYYQELLKLVEGKDYEATVNKVLLRSLQKARYDSRPLGHFGLALVDYCHFTSPIRRYPDLTIHRIIKRLLKKGLSATEKDNLSLFVEESAIQSSETERNAEKAEREVDDLWKAYLMKDKVGESFEGIITSVVSYGLFIELDNTCEGLLRIEDLPQDGYLFFERELKLKGQKHCFAIGDRVRVVVTNASIVTRKIDFGYKG